MNDTLPESLLPYTNKARDLLLQLLMGMLGAAILLLFFHVLDPPRQVVAVDVTGIIDHFVKAEADSKLPAAQLRKQVATFGQALDNTLRNIARNQQLVLLPREAVITGAKDITREVEAKVNAQLNVPDGTSTHHKS